MSIQVKILKNTLVHSMRLKIFHSISQRVNWLPYSAHLAAVKRRYFVLLRV